MRMVLALLYVLMPLINGQFSKPVKIIHQWNQVEFAFPSDVEKRTAIDSGNYVRGKSIPIDVDFDSQETRVFVTIPRFQNGVPITLGVVERETSYRIPVVSAYPAYKIQSLPASKEECDEHIISVVRIAIDECHRLWVLDTGKVGEVQHCQPQLLVIDLSTDTIIHRYRFPKLQYSDKSLFVTPIVDVKNPLPYGNCDNTHVYIADVGGYALLSYDMRAQKSWRIENKLFYPFPNHGTFHVAGESFELMDGIFGLALTPHFRNYNGRDARSIGSGNYGLSRSGLFNLTPQRNDRYLYFHSLAASTENIVPLQLLENSTYWESNPGGSPGYFRKMGSRGQQSSAQAMDKNGNLFFSLLEDDAVGCWNFQKFFAAPNIRIVAQNHETMQFISGMKVIKNRKGREELWILSCRFQKVIAGTMRLDETNFRIQVLSIDELIGGTIC